MYYICFCFCVFWSESSHSFSKILAELEEKVLRMLFESYGVEKHYDSYVESTAYLLRYMKYEVPKSDENNVVFPCHTDKTFMTVLYQLNQVSGLEVQARNGEWISVEFPPSSFIVMAGEAIKVISHYPIPPYIYVCMYTQVKSFSTIRKWLKI